LVVEMKELKIADRVFSSRLFLGSGKFSSTSVFRKAIAASGTQLVTVSLTRVDLNSRETDNILSAIDSDEVQIMLNTSGARNADEACRIAQFGRAAGYNWIKLEIHPDPTYLLPDPIETLIAAEKLVKAGFIVLPYINADPALAQRLEEVGVHTVMPLGAPIGSNQGLQTAAMLRIIIEQSNIPVIVDAGIGLPSHAAAAIEMGADAVLVNTAIAAADDPEKMACAFKLAVQSAEMGREAGPAARGLGASATSPLASFNEIF